MSANELVAPAPPTASDAPIWNVFLAAFHAPAMVIADELGLFAAIGARPATAAELATTAGVELRAIETLVGLLAALGLLAHADGRFHLTETARTYLVPSSPYYWGGFLRRIRDNPLDCNKLIASLRKGQAAGDARVTSAWAAPVPPPHVLEAFTHAMHAHSFALAMRIAPSLGLDGATRLLDVAGGSGSYSIAAALHHPGLAVTLLDLPPVCAVAAQYAARAGVADRISRFPANMFTDPWPMDHDRVLMSDIFHDWDDERCAWLAARAFEALRPGGRLVLHEMILADGKDGPLAAAAYSMAMVFHTQGRQRSAAELSALLAGAGFTDISITMTANGYAAICGTRA